MINHSYSSIIWLSKGKYAIVDNECAQDISQHKWWAMKGGKKFYATRKVNRKILSMHYQIMNIPITKGWEVDHKNGNPLDNRKVNLRLCTKQQNQFNKANQPHSSKYKGVFYYQSRKKWVASIRINRKSKFLGYFHNEIDAGLAYNLAAKELFGEFAWLNVISL